MSRPLHETHAGAMVLHRVMYDTATHAERHRMLARDAREQAATHDAEAERAEASVAALRADLATLTGDPSWRPPVGTRPLPIATDA